MVVDGKFLAFVLKDINHPEVSYSQGVHRNESDTVRYFNVRAAKKKKKAFGEGYISQDLIFLF